MIVANATGCSSIYGANLPTTPWTVNAAGRGPAWNNSLFEDNAEFGLGMRLALDAQTDHARRLVERLAPKLGADSSSELLEGPRRPSRTSTAQRERVARLREALGRNRGRLAADARHLLALADDLVRQGIWIIGGDGWAYDIGFGGLDQVLSSGRNVNILVLDTEVYSNTGGQASKATPRGAVAKFAAAGKGTAKKDLGAIARVLRQCLRRPDLDGCERPPDHQGAARGGRLAGSVARHRLQHLHRARHRHVEVDDPPEGRGEERVLAAVSVPAVRSRGRPSIQARLGAPSIPIADFVATETRFAVLQRTHPERAAELASWPRPTPTNDGATTSSSRASSAPFRTSIDPIRRSCPRSRAMRATATRTRRTGMTVDLRPAISAWSSGRRSSRRPRPATASRAWPGGSNAAGVGAIVMPSLFEEEILAEELGLNRSLEQGTEHFAEALDYFPAVDTFVGAADRYLGRARTDQGASAVPIIASLNASTAGGWVRYARRIEDAGADALELNLYRVAADPRRTAADMEAADLELIAAVRAAIRIPLAVKLSPYYSAFANFAAAAAEPVPTASCCSTASTSRTSTWKRSTWCHASTEPAVGAAAARALDRDPAAAARARRVDRGDLGLQRGPTWSRA